jgi:hypothetical protein
MIGNGCVLPWAALTIPIMTKVTQAIAKKAERILKPAVTKASGTLTRPCAILPKIAVMKAIPTLPISPVMANTRP